MHPNQLFCSLVYVSKFVQFKKGSDYLIRGTTQMFIPAEFGFKKFSYSSVLVPVLFPFA